MSKEGWEDRCLGWQQNEMELWQEAEVKAERARAHGDAAGAVNALYEAACADRLLRLQRKHYSGYLFALHYLSGIAPEQLFAAHRVYGALYRDTEPLPPGGAPHEGLRVGYLAPHFHDGAAARFYEAMLFLAGRPPGLAVYTYALHPADDAYSRRVVANTQYRDLSGRSIVEAGERIWQDGLDLLIDLGGHSAGGETLMVLALRPAPVQAEAMGYFDTTGLPAMDFLLTDEALDPAGGPHFATERLACLQPSLFCFTPTAEMREAREGQLREERQSGGPFVFGCFQNILKCSDAWLEAVSKILREAKTSRLILQDVLPLPERLAAVRGRCARAGLPMDRVTIRGGREAYLSDYAAVDLVLDTFPYPGGAMTATALYLGVPVLTLTGDHHSARFGAAILRAAGRTNWAADTAEEYVARAIAASREPARVRAERRRLLETLPASALLDEKDYQKALLSLYQSLKGGAT